MQLHQFFHKETFTFTYLLLDKSSKQAIIIDPVKDEVKKYLDYLEEYHLSLFAVLDTHIHADHITGAFELKKTTGCQVMIGAGSSNTPKGIDHFCKDSEVITVGNLNIQCLYTPGHTDDSYCFVCDDCVFTGDTLFINGTGRTDFQNGDASKSFHSITQKLFTLPDETVVYPGHDYKGQTQSTIGKEKSQNPRLAGKTEAEYVTIMQNLNLDRPKHMDVAVPANLNEGE